MGWEEEIDVLAEQGNDRMDEEDYLEAVEFFDREGTCFRNQKHSGRKRGGCSRGSARRTRFEGAR